MPEFVSPFKGKDSQTLNRRELTRAIRLAIASELEAIHLYEALADATSDKDVVKVFQSIANEEKVHVGELEALLRQLDPSQEELFVDGLDEATDLVARVMGRI